MLRAWYVYIWDVCMYTHSHTLCVVHATWNTYKIVWHCRCTAYNQMYSRVGVFIFCWVNNNKMRIQLSNTCVWIKRIRQEKRNKITMYFLTKQSVVWLSTVHLSWTVYTVQALVLESPWRRLWIRTKIENENQNIVWVVLLFTFTIRFIQALANLSTNNFLGAFVHSWVRKNPQELARFHTNSHNTMNSQATLWNTTEEHAQEDLFHGSF